MGSQVTNPTHALSFGSIPDLVNRTAHPAGYWFDTMSDESDFGSPQPVEVAIRQLLDGSVTEITGHDNREIVLRVNVCANDAASLAAGELALAAEVGGRNVLAWTPPQPGATTSYFDVVSSSLESVTDMPRELMTMRVYRLHLTCLPFARPADLTLTEALSDGTDPGTATTTVLDSCSATTGWTGTDGVFLGDGAGGGPTGTVTTDTTGPRDKNVTLYLERTFSPTVVPGPYLRVKAGTFEGSLVGDFKASADGVSLSLVSKNGSTRYYAAPTTAVAKIRITATVKASSGGTSSFAFAGIYVDELAMVNVDPSVGTPRQLSRSLTVGGSARTQGSLAIEHQTSTLGTVLVHTGPEETPTPALRPYLTASGTTTPESARVSGAFNVPGTTAVTFTVPAADCPAGPYQLMAYMCDTSPGTARTITWTVASQVGGSDVGSPVSGTVTYTFATTGVYEAVPLGLVSLPPNALPDNSNGSVRITISVGSSVSTVRLDEAWRFYATEDCALTWVTGAGQRMWIDAADVDHPLPQIWTGTASDRADAYAASVSAWGEHVFPPGNGQVFTITSNAQGAAVSLQHYRRYHTHVVDEG